MAGGQAGRAGEGVGEGVGRGGEGWGVRPASGNMAEGAPQGVPFFLAQC